MSKHTPKPWSMTLWSASGKPASIYAQTEDERSDYPDDHHEATIELCFFVDCDEDGYIDSDEMIANANLMVAAPDLLEVLEGMVETLQAFYDDPDNELPDTRQMIDARAAIAKANGVTK